MTRSRVAHYFVAAAVVGLPAAIKPPIEHLVGPGPPLIFFVPAVAIAAWVGGLGPGLLAVGLSTAICCYSYLPPIGSFWVEGANDRFRLLLFWLQGAMTSFLMGQLHAAGRKAENHRDSLGRSEGQIRALMDDVPAVISIKDAEARSLMTNPHRITEQGRAEGSLKENEGRLGLFIEHAPAAIAMFDREMKSIAASRRRRAESKLGEQTLNGWSHDDIVPDIPERWKVIHRRALLGGVVEADEDRFDRADGTVLWLRWEARPRLNDAGELGGIVIATEDITERKDIAGRPRKSEEEFRALADAIPQTGWMVNRNHHIFLKNKKRYDHKYNIADRVEVPPRRADAAFRPSLTRVNPFQDTDGRITRWSGTNTDISERRRAEENNVRLAAIVDSSDDAIVGKDLEGVITSWNAAAGRLFGYTADEAVGSPVTLIIPRDRLDEEAEILDKMRRGIPVDHYETVRRRKDGRLVDVSLTVSTIRDMTGRVVGASKIARDITERKRADEVVAHLAAIVDSSEDSIVSEDLDGLVVSWNAGAQRIFGYAPDEAIGRPIDAVLNRPDRPGGAADLLANAGRGEPLRNFETQRLRKDGGLVDVSVTISAIYDRAGKRIGISRIDRDITERKRAEGASRESERMARSILDSISSRVAVLDESGTILGVNRSWRSFAEANGVVGQDHEGTNYLDACDSAAGEDREMAAFAAGIREVLVGQRASFELEYPRHSPSQRRWFIGRVTPFPNGGPRRVVVSHEDVSDLEVAEEHLRHRERMLSQSQMMAHVGSWELDLDLDPDNPPDFHAVALRWSDECLRIFGYKPGQVDVTNDLFLRAVHPDDREAVPAALSRALRENGSYGIEHRIVRPDGIERVVFEWGETIFDPGGRPIRVLGTCQDITERKRIEEELRYQLRLNRAITEKIGESIFLIDEQGRLLFMNEEAARVFGFTFEELGGTVLHDAIHHHHPDGRPFPWEDCSSASVCRTGQGTRSREDAYFRKDGSVVEAVCANAPLEVDGRRIGVVFILHDITERKRSEVALQHYASRLEHLREIDRAILSSHSPREIAEAAMGHLARLVPYWTAGVSVYDFDRDEVEVLATDGLLREWHPPGTRYQEELKARPEIYDLIHEHVSIDQEAQASPLMEALRVAGMRSSVSIPLREGGRPIGSLLLVSDSPAAFSAERIEVAREVADHLAIAIRQAILLEDLGSARARMEALSRQLLRAQEDERRRIARELHDEIGQAMTALKINLQTLIQGGEDGAARLEESVAIVDQTLQQVRGMALDLRPSILDDLGLVAALEWYIGRHAQRTGLHGRLVADPGYIQADPEIETTCFRVAQEALTNVARHARATRFSVELVQHRGGLQLVVRDDGIGFDPEAALGAASRGVSSGLAGMRERVELVGGRIAFVSEPAEGAEIQVDFSGTPIMPRKVSEEDGPGGPK